MKEIQRFIRTLLGLIVALLITACSSDDAETGISTNNEEIRFNVDAWQMMDGSAATRATTFDDQAALRSEGAFTCTIYDDGTTTEFLTATQVNWYASQWMFSDGYHKWPDSGNIDFFAYMPAQGNLASEAPYIGTVSYATAEVPSFTCISMPGTDAREFVYAFVKDRNKAEHGSTGVTLSFRHPFARIIFNLTNTSGVTINSITIDGLKTSGTYTHDAPSTAWSSQAGSGTLTGTTDTPYIVIPYNYGSKTITVNATWTDWSNVTKDVSATVPINWEVGTSYTYNITLSKYALKVDTSTKYTEQW